MMVVNSVFAFTPYMQPVEYTGFDRFKSPSYAFGVDQQIANRRLSEQIAQNINHHASWLNH